MVKSYTLMSPPAWVSSITIITSQSSTDSFREASRSSYTVLTKNRSLLLSHLSKTVKSTSYRTEKAQRLKAPAGHNLFASKHHQGSTDSSETLRTPTHGLIRFRRTPL